MLIDEAAASGARLRPSCDVLGLDTRTVQRWRTRCEDGRSTCTRSSPANRLSDGQRQRVLDVASTPRFRDVSPKQIVAELADEGMYVASESTFYRVLRAASMQSHRGRARPPAHSKPREKVATGPNQVWSWDITYLRGPMRGQFFYLYLVLDVWSRKIVGWAVHHEECGTYAARLVQRATLREGSPADLVLHSDRGSPMTSATLLAMLDSLAVKTSYSRPRISDDNPFSESLFRTLKYRPAYPSKPFESIAAARAWVEHFVDWYNHEHRHSSIGFVTPDQRHQGVDVALLAQRRVVYEAARRAHPERWTGKTRAWSRPVVVALNPSDETRERLAS